MTECFFDAHELDARIAATRQEMAAAGLDVLLLASPENIYHLTGLNHHGHFALTVLVVPLDGHLRIVARAMEAPTLGVQVPQCLHVPFTDEQDPAGIIAELVRSLAAGGTVGVERTSMNLPVSVWEPLRLALDGLRVTDASDLVGGIRQVKSPAEIAYVRRAAAASSRAMDAGLAAVTEGITPGEVAAAVYAELAAGPDWEHPAAPPLIRSRESLLLEHAPWDGQPIGHGGAVFLELTASVARYHAPLTRMAYLGEAPPGTDAAASIAASGLEAVRDALRPGARAREVYAAWQAVVDEGLGHAEYRRHHCGYVIGIGFPPSWTGGGGVVGLRRDSELEIRAGMTFHVLSWLLGQQPADYVLSDTMLVTAEGGEILTSARRDPIVV